jgi:hypothetical protein
MGHHAILILALRTNTCHKKASGNFKGIFQEGMDVEQACNYGEKTKSCFQE